MSEHFRKRKQVGPLPTWLHVVGLAFVFAIVYGIAYLSYAVCSLLFDLIAATLA